MPKTTDDIAAEIVQLALESGKAGPEVGIGIIVIVTKFDPRGLDVGCFSATHPAVKVSRVLYGVGTEREQWEKANLGKPRSAQRPKPAKKLH